MPTSISRIDVSGHHPRAMSQHMQVAIPSLCGEHSKLISFTSSDCGFSSKVSRPLELFNNRSSPVSRQRSEAANQITQWSVQNTRKFTNLKDCAYSPIRLSAKHRSLSKTTSSILKGLPSIFSNLVNSRPGPPLRNEERTTADPPMASLLLPTESCELAISSLTRPERTKFSFLGLKCCKDPHLAPLESLP